MDVQHDRNNNMTTVEKSYSLRPRAAARREDQEVEQEEVWKPRGRSRKKLKQKSVPLSKYRRKTANARERFRMREINEAFEALRRAIPHLSSTCENPNEKMTKISTLRMAMKYITALTNALQDADFDSDADSFFSEWTTSPDLRETSTPSSLNDHSDLYDQFFSLSSSSETSPSTSSPYSIPTLHTPSPSELSSSNASRLSGSPSYPAPRISSKQDTINSDGRLFIAPSATPASSSLLSKSFLMTPSCSTDLEDITDHLIATDDLQGCSVSLLDELGISPSSVDLDDYLVT